MTMHIARKVVQSFQQTAAMAQPAENLSEREQQVLDLLTQGLMYKEIAEKLGISYETVHTYIRRTSGRKIAGAHADDKAVAKF